MVDEDLAESTIAELQSAMADGTLDSQRLTAACLRRIELIDRSGPMLNSVIEVNPDGRAIAAELDRDRELAVRFRQALDLLPPYPTAPDAAGQPIVVDWTGCKFREIGEHNITVPAVPPASMKSPT